MGLDARLAAIESARLRRADAAKQREVRIQWFINEVSQKVAITLRNRVRMATEYLRDRVVRNISRPVTKKIVDVGRSFETTAKNRAKKTVVTDRSKPGEFPKADTTQLMKTVFSDVKEEIPGMINGYVGTPLDYGLILELRLNRKFLTRTLDEEYDMIEQLLLGPIK